MKSISILALLSIALLAGSATLTEAGIDVDLGASVAIGDRTDLYFAISSRYFDEDRDDVARWGKHYTDPDDLAVALFISKHSDRTLGSLFELRSRGWSWWRISLEVGMRMDRWFVRVKENPGPPYGNAYGHWKKHRKNPEAMALSDDEARNLVAVRMIHEYYDVSVEVAMDWRSSGRDLPTLMAGEYEKRHGKSPSQSGKGKGKKK